MDEKKEELFYQPKNGYDLIGPEERIACEDYCREYMAYLDAARTEREAVTEAVKLAEIAGFAPLEENAGPEGLLEQPGQEPAAGRGRQKAHERGIRGGGRPRGLPPAGPEAKSAV